MPIIGYKCKFKDIPSINDYIFTINFNLNYTDYGALKINDKDDNYFDVGDFRIKTNKMIEQFDENKYKEYDIGISILSICKYIVDTIPSLFSISCEDGNMVDTYYKDEIIEDYKKIKQNRNL